MLTDLLKELTARMPNPEEHQENTLQPFLTYLLSRMTYSDWI
jgi:hypothetical protein